MKVLSPLVQFLAASSALQSVTAAPAGVRSEFARNDALTTNPRARADDAPPRQDIHNILEERKGGGGGGGGKGGGAKGGGSKSSKTSGGGSSNNAQWGVCGPVAGGAATLLGYGGVELARRMFGSTRSQVTGGVLGALVGGAAGTAYCVTQEVRIAKERKNKQQQPQAAA